MASFFLLFAVAAILYVLYMQRSGEKIAEIFDECTQQHKGSNSSTNPSILHLNSLYETQCFLLSTHRVALS